MKIEDIKENENNPRGITEQKLLKLKKSIVDFERMMEIRPIIVDETNIIISGNQRFRALKEMGYIEIPDKWIKQITNFTEKEKKELLIKDNLAFGEWDWVMLKDNWDTTSLENWGLDTPFSGGLFNKDIKQEEKEIDTTYKVIITFNDEEEYEKFKEHTGLNTNSIYITKKSLTLWQ